MNKAFYFCGQIIPDALIEKDYEALKKHVSPAANTFYNALLNGICENGYEVYTSTALPEELRNMCASEYKGPWNMKFRKQPKPFPLRVIMNFLCSFKEIFGFSKKQKNAEKYAIFNVLRLGASLGGILACKLAGVKKIGIVTDVAGYRIKTEESEKPLAKLIDRIGRNLLKKFDCYVLLSEAMAEVMPIKKKPYVVIEGLYQPRDTEEQPPSRYDDFTVLYAGSLFRQYGIMNLVDAVRQFNGTDIKLLIYGEGEAKDEICEIAKQDPRILYMGSVSHGEILLEERRASLLVNPRPVDDEYVKYSFPSKNMEYMASGTPVLLTNLPSLPEEYKPFAYIVEDNEVETLYSKIKDIKSGFGKDDYYETSKNARLFIVENKNPSKQVQKMLEIL